MQFDIIALPKGGNPKKIVHLSSQNPSIWEHLCYSLLRNGVAVDVFICMSYSERLFKDRRSLENIIGNAPFYTWGADIYLVLEQDINVLTEYSVGDISLNRWFDVLYKKKIKDIIEIPKSLSSLNIRRCEKSMEELCKILAIRSKTSKKNYDFFISQTQLYIWRCLMSEEQFTLKPFVEPFIYKQNFQTNFSFIISCTRNYKKQIYTYLNSFPESRFGIVVDDYDVYESLKDYQEISRNEKIVGVLRYYGPFGFRYIMQRLNRCLLERKERKQSNVKELKNTKSIFSNFSNEENFTILFTNSFALDRKNKDDLLCLESAYDIGYLTHNIPENCKKIVLLKSTLEALEKVVGEQEGNLIWVHLGHGMENNNLLDINGNEAKPEEWLSSFNKFKGCFVLALFLTCYSEKIARYFTEAGVKVSIGFESKILPEPCRILALKTIQAAISKTVSQKKLLEAFDLGCGVIRDAGYKDTYAIAFHSYRW